MPLSSHPFPSGASVLGRSRSDSRHLFKRTDLLPGGAAGPPGWPKMPRGSYSKFLVLAFAVPLLFLILMEIFKRGD